MQNEDFRGSDPLVISSGLYCRCITQWRSGVSIAFKKKSFSEELKRLQRFDLSMFCAQFLSDGIRLMTRNFILQIS